MSYYKFKVSRGWVYQEQHKTNGTIYEETTIGELYKRYDINSHIADGAGHRGNVVMIVDKKHNPDFENQHDEYRIKILHKTGTAWVSAITFPFLYDKL